MIVLMRGTNADMILKLGKSNCLRKYGSEKNSKSKKNVENFVKALGRNILGQKVDPKSST